MAFKVGHQRFGGRSKGTLNSRTADLTEELVRLRFNLPEYLHRIMPKLAIDKQAEIIVKLMEFVYPRRKAVEVTESPDPMDRQTDIPIERLKEIARELLREDDEAGDAVNSSPDGH